MSEATVPRYPDGSRSMTGGQATRVGTTIPLNSFLGEFNGMVVPILYRILFLYGIGTFFLLKKNKKK